MQCIIYYVYDEHVEEVLFEFAVNCLFACFKWLKYWRLSFVSIIYKYCLGLTVNKEAYEIEVVYQMLTNETFTWIY